MVRFTVRVDSTSLICDSSVCKRVTDVRCFNKGHVARCSECQAVFQPFKGCCIHSYNEGFNLSSKPHAEKKKPDISQTTAIVQEEDKNENNPPDNCQRQAVNEAQGGQAVEGVPPNLQELPQEGHVHGQPLVLQRPQSQSNCLENARPNNNVLGVPTYENWKSTKGKAKKARRCAQSEGLMDP